MFALLPLYHACQIYQDVKTYFSLGQLARMARELDPDIGRRTAVVYTPCEVGTVPGEVELDCNANGVPDDCDLAAGTSRDCNANGAPDECDLSPQGFAFGDQIRLKGGVRPNSILAVDLDGDALADLVTAAGGDNGIRVGSGAGRAISGELGRRRLRCGWFP